MTESTLDSNQKSPTGNKPSTGHLTRKFLLAFTPVIVILSGLVAILMAGWNAAQVAPLLQWAAEREGKEIFARVIHEGPLSPGAVLKNPDQLQTLIADDSEIVAAMVMQGDLIVASFSKEAGLLVAAGQLPAETGAAILNDRLSVYRRFSGPGSGSETGRQQGSGGRGPRWLRGLDENSAPGEESRQNQSRLSIVFVFIGPDRGLVRPLIYQTYLWPFVWLFLTILWSILLLFQQRSTRMQAEMQKESHLAAIGKMSARLAHEIRNPLGAIRGIAQLLQKKISAETELNLIQTIEQETFRLDDLTSSILDFSRPLQCNLVSLNAGAVVGNTVDLFRQQHQTVHIDLKLPATEIICRADENAVRQILLNLLKNAVDASESHNTIEVGLFSAAGSASIRVSNKGEPLSESMLEDIFEPFVSTKARGYGLGLPISRKLAESMHGCLRLYNAAGGLITAELTLKLETRA
ncbi:MAG: ATP-binding protein [Candidatus Riflebacteria bacterium]|nr:ATP-binding protein [Candidatus Riflebacteria bacterium]